MWLHYICSKLDFEVGNEIYVSGTQKKNIPIRELGFWNLAISTNIISDKCIIVP